MTEFCLKPMMTISGFFSRQPERDTGLGIMPELIEPGKPHQNGRHERFHRTLKAETTCPMYPDFFVTYVPGYSRWQSTRNPDLSNKTLAYYAKNLLR